MECPQRQIERGEKGEKESRVKEVARKERGKWLLVYKTDERVPRNTTGDGQLVAPPERGRAARC
jgi:hypothetical protein